MTPLDEALEYAYDRERYITMQYHAVLTAHNAPGSTQEAKLGQRDTEQPAKPHRGAQDA